MFEKEKKELMNLINEKTIKLQEIKKEEKRIEEKRELINDQERYKDKLRDIKSILGLILIVVIALAIYSFNNTSIIKAIDFLLIAYGIFGLPITIPILIKMHKLKKLIKENKEEYEKAKESEEKDKELKLALTEEYIRIDKELVPLNDMIAWYNKTEEMQKTGKIVDIKLSKTSQAELTEEEQKENEKEIFTNVDLDTCEVDNSQKLEMKL